MGVTYTANGTSVCALADVSFETREREFLAVVGPSGCGKTTLLRVLAGLQEPTGGVVERITLPGDQAQRALLVFQENSLFPWMTVLENAAFGLEMQAVGRREREGRARAMLERFGLAGRERAYPHQLSVGMKQRVAVIRSFLSEPSLLLMDEPFAAADAQTRAGLQQELLAIWEQEHRSVIFVTHDVDEAILLSDRILVLSAQPGAVVAEFRVPFPRPRETTVTLDEQLLALKRRIWAKLDRTVKAPSRGAEGRPT
ncbi:MAG: ABC transporter ATP-binding protein [Acidobacteria bacterium]|nr:ABC transporter ATP-binding protein [Acidobacteriota bacterium]